MEWLERLKIALDYLEANLETDLEIKEAARLACCSTFHFQRMFHILTGFTVVEYVRNRRLTLAAQELAMGNARVIDVALKYGYDTPESFSKAFRRLHGVNPSTARGSGVNLKAFPRISFYLSIKGDKDMDYKIVEKEAFAIVGKRIRVTTKDKQNLKLIPEFWTECCQKGICCELAANAGKLGLLGVCMNFNPDAEELTYMIGIEKPQSKVLTGFEEKEIPASTWAVFESIGPMPTPFSRCGRGSSPNGSRPQATNIPGDRRLRPIHPVIMLLRITGARFGFRL
mgnify:CR=1 FL=1